MRKEYFKALEGKYGYTANWAPNEDVQIGAWTDIESGFIPWINRVRKNNTPEMEINDGLHNVMRGVLEEVTTKKKKLAPMFMSHQVSMDAGISGGPASIKAKKAGGFFAVLQDIYEISAEPASFQEKLQELNKTSVALISSVTYVKKGIIVIFSEDTASFTLPIGFSLDTMINKPGEVDLDVAFSYTSEGMIAYKAEPGKKLTPFVKIHVVNSIGHKTPAAPSRKGKSPIPTMSYVMGPQDFVNSAPRFVKPTETYDIQPFSYTDFFETMKL